MIKNILHNQYFSYIYILYFAILAYFLLFTNLILSDICFYVAIISLLISFITSIQARNTLTKVFRFMDFRNNGVHNHTKEILEPTYTGTIKKDSDTFYIKISKSSFLFGLVSIVISLALVFI